MIKNQLAKDTVEFSASEPIKDKKKKAVKEVIEVAKEIADNENIALAINEEAVANLEASVSKRHEKYRPIPQPVVCVKCGVQTGYSRKPLRAMRATTTVNRTLRFKDGHTETTPVTKEIKTGSYLCSGCQ